VTDVWAKGDPAKTLADIAKLFADLMAMTDQLKPDRILIPRRESILLRKAAKPYIRLFPYRRPCYTSRVVLERVVS
jgi:hypothetical protein